MSCKTDFNIGSNVHTPIGHKLGIWAASKPRGSIDRKRININNMNPFAVVEPRGFHAAEIPSLWPIGVYKNIQCNIAWKALKRNGLRDDDQITASILWTKYPAIHCHALSSKTLLTVLKCQESKEEKTCSIFLKKLENQGKCARIADLAFREWFAGNILNMDNPIP